MHHSTTSMVINPGGLGTKVLIRKILQTHHSSLTRASRQLTPKTHTSAKVSKISYSSRVYCGVLFVKNPIHHCPNETTAELTN